MHDNTYFQCQRKILHYLIAAADEDFIKEKHKKIHNIIANCRDVFHSYSIQNISFLNSRDSRANILSEYQVSTKEFFFHSLFFCSVLLKFNAYIVWFFSSGEKNSLVQTPTLHLKNYLNFEEKKNRRWAIMFGKQQSSSFPFLFGLLKKCSQLF